MQRKFNRNATRFIKNGKQLNQDTPVKDLDINNNDVIHTVYRLGSNNIKTFWLDYYNIPIDRPINEINCYEMMKRKNITNPYIPYARSPVACLDGSQCLAGQLQNRLDQLRLLGTQILLPK